MHLSGELRRSESPQLLHCFFPSPFSDTTTVSGNGNTSPGQTAVITTAFQDTAVALANGLLDIEVYNSSGQKVGQQYWTGKNLAFGQSATETYNWVAPSTIGPYTVEAGVFGPNWSPNYYWNSNAGTINVN